MRLAPRATRAALPLVALVTLGTACSDATGSVQGGEPRFDAGTDTTGPGGLAPTFTTLYAAYFGPQGKASCAGDGACHGAADQPGAQATAGPAYLTGYVCAPDKESCWRNMTGAGLTVIGAGSGAEQTTLFTILRKTGGGGSMPKRPESIAFSPTEIAQVRAWLAAGAKND